MWCKLANENMTKCYYFHDCQCVQRSMNSLSLSVSIYIYIHLYRPSTYLENVPMMVGFNDGLGMYLRREPNQWCDP